MQAFLVFCLLIIKYAQYFLQMMNTENSEGEELLQHFLLSWIGNAVLNGLP